MSLNFFFSSLESMTKADEGIQYEGVGAISGGNCAKVALSSEPEVDVHAAVFGAGGPRRAPEPTASFHDTQAALRGQWERRGPWEPLGGPTSSSRLDGGCTQQCGLAAARGGRAAATPSSRPSP